MLSSTTTMEPGQHQRLVREVAQRQSPPRGGRVSTLKLQEAELNSEVFLQFSELSLCHLADKALVLAWLHGRGR